MLVYLFLALLLSFAALAWRELWLVGEGSCNQSGKSIEGEMGSGGVEGDYISDASWEITRFEHNTCRLAFLGQAWWSLFYIAYVFNSSLWSYYRFLNFTDSGAVSFSQGVGNCIWMIPSFKTQKVWWSACLNSKGKKIGLAILLCSCLSVLFLFQILAELMPLGFPPLGQMVKAAALGCAAAQTRTAALPLQGGLSAETACGKLTVGKWSVVSDLEMPLPSNPAGSRWMRLSNHQRWTGC